MKKQALFSGIRATSEPHLGNYLGAIKQFIENQNDYECFFSVVDLHSLTTPFEPKELRENSLAVIADFIALGLDPAKCTLFLQSQVSEHAELAWILSCITPLGELQRMTQFKDKSSQVNKESINAGLLTYPVLMAADILLYKADVVPVGEDQAQHLELARTIAKKFNNKFGKTFPEPKTLLNKSARIMSLTQPDKKMSKTGGEGILLNDSPETIKKKLRKAVTATDAKGKSRGVENLFTLLREFGTADQIKYFENAYKENTIQYSELKEALADCIANYFEDFRYKREQLIGDTRKLAEILSDGAIKARAVASQTLREVKEKVGLL